MPRFAVKRIYDPPDVDDGYRVLVDRLWPRGISKERAALDEWAKDLAPSTDLRRWFGHVPERFAEFSTRYQRELADNAELPKYLADWRRHAVVTLLFGARDTVHNEAVVLRAYLESGGALRD